MHVSYRIWPIVTSIDGDRGSITLSPELSVGIEQPVGSVLEIIQTITGTEEPKPPKLQLEEKKR